MLAPDSEERTGRERRQTGGNVTSSGVNTSPLSHPVFRVDVFLGRGAGIYAKCRPKWRLSPVFLAAELEGTMGREDGIQAHPAVVTWSGVKSYL